MLKRNKLTWIRWTVTYWFRNSFLLNEKCLYKNLKIFLMSWFFRIYQEFSRILEKFHFSISISRHFYFTFHSRSRSWDIFISLFTLDLDIKVFSFHFSFSKWVNQIFISLFTSRTSNTHSRRTLRQSRVCREDGSRPGGSSWGPSLQSSPAFQGNMRRSISTHAMTFKSRCKRIILNYRSGIQKAYLTQWTQGPLRPPLVEEGMSHRYQQR